MRSGKRKEKKRGDKKGDEKKSLEKIESMKAKRGTYAQKMKKAAAVPSTGKKGPKTRWLPRLVQIMPLLP